MAANPALEALIAIGTKLFGKRTPLVAQWQEIADQFYPERGEFTRAYVEGSNYADWLYDSTPVMLRRDLGNNLSSILRPSGSIWFKARTGDKTIDEKVANLKWLDNATAILRRAYYRSQSGTVGALKSCDHDFVTFGNGVISIYARPGQKHMTVRNHHLKDVVWLENEEGEVDHVQRARKMSGRDMAKRFPKTIPAEVTKANVTDSTIEYDVRNIVVPSEEYYGDTGRRGKKFLPFIDLWVDTKTKTVLEETPRAEQCYVIPRWHRMSGSQYAVSPAALVALPDARMIQALKRIILEAGEKAVDPPTIATEDAILGGINIQAGGVTWVDGDYDEKMGEALRALELGQNPLLGVQLLQDVRKNLADCWFTNKLNLPDDKEMTAFEAGQRIKEYARGAMPIFEPFGPGYSALVLDRMFVIQMRLGAFGSPADIPTDLKGADVDWQFETPVEEAEGRANVYAFGEVSNIIATAAQADPKAVRNVDINKSMRDAIRGTSAPGDWLVDEQVLAQQDAQEAANPPPPSAQDLGSAAELIKNGAAATAGIAKASIFAKKANGASI